jgi:hypothetical protein
MAKNRCFRYVGRWPVCVDRAVHAAKSLAQPWLHDPKVVPLPWDYAKVAAMAKAEQLMFGVIWTDGLRQHTSLHLLREATRCTPSLLADL